MKKTAITIAMMTLILIGTVAAQPTRRVAGSTALGGGSGIGIKNRQPINMRKRIDKATPVVNLGDTATHEVGHKGKRPNGQFRPNPTGDGTTQQFRKTNTNGQNNRSRNPQTTDSYLKIEGIDGEGLKRPQANGIKFEGIDGESNDARTKKPNGQRNNNVIRTETVDNNEYSAKRPLSVKGMTEYVDNDEYRTKRPNRRKR